MANNPKKCNHPTCQGGLCRREQKQKTPTKIRKKALPKSRQGRIILLDQITGKAEIISPVKDDNSRQINLVNFFEKMMRISVPVCENCGAYANWITSPAYKTLWKSSMAHILPKKIFRSIETNELNILVMFPSYSGVCDCHTNYDSSWHKASSMRVWPKVVERFKMLYPLISQEERKHIPEVLLREL